MKLPNENKDGVGGSLANCRNFFVAASLFLPFNIAWMQTHGVVINLTNPNIFFWSIQYTTTWTECKITVAIVMYSLLTQTSNIASRGKTDPGCCFTWNDLADQTHIKKVTVHSGFTWFIVVISRKDGNVQVLIRTVSDKDSDIDVAALRHLMLPLFVLQMCNIFCSSVVAYYVSNLFQKSCICNLLVVSTFSSNFRWKMCPLCTNNLHFFVHPPQFFCTPKKKSVATIICRSQKVRNSWFTTGCLSSPRRLAVAMRDQLVSNLCHPWIAASRQL